MKARAVLLVFMCSTLGLSALAQDAAGVMQSATHPWQMRNATAARTGQSASVGATLGELDWRINVAGYAPQIAVAQDGSIYLGTVFNENNWNNESYAYALTSAGGLKWREKVTSYEWGASQGTSGGPAVDDAGNVDELAAAARAAGVSLGVLVEVEVGQRRCGVDPGEPAVALARHVLGRAPALRFLGLQGYAGHIQMLPDVAERATQCRAGLQLLADTRRELEAAGIPVAVVTGAGTGTVDAAAGFRG